MQKRGGFALLEVIIVLAILALLFGGGWYAKNLQREQSMIETGVDAQKKAIEVKQQLEKQARDQQKMIP